jgi:predicted nucleic acid-binding Zn ribbon protein
VENSNVKKASEILARILDEKGRETGTTYSSVFGGWSSMVGESLAEHSRVYEVRNRNLFVEVDHPGWMQLLLMKKPQILRSVKRKYAVLNIRDIKIKVNLTYQKMTHVDTKSDKGPQGSSTEELREVDRIVSPVRSDELKGHLKRLFLKSIEKERAG